LFPLMEFVNLYSMLCGNESPNICWSDHENDSDEYIHLAKCLLHAAVLVKSKKHSMAVEFLRYKYPRFIARIHPFSYFIFFMLELQ
jgi:hypothetical protein